MPSVNQRISEYVLEAKVGGGAFGEVWRAHHHVWTDQLVAIKIPLDPTYVRNFQREGFAIHGLVHPNIVRAIGFDPYADPPYLTMEYVPGTSLRPLIKDRKLSIEDAIDVMRQVLSGLQYAHQHGVIHRDVKPENILVHEQALAGGMGVPGAVKVTDFGLGRVATTTAVGSIAYSASMNNAAGAEIAGTLDYMAPEQRSGGESDARVDLYAAGVVLYELLTGERPAGTELPSEINPQVPKYLDEVFKRSYARLDKRYASAGEFIGALSPQPPAIPMTPPLPLTGAPRPFPQYNAVLPVVPGPTVNRKPCPQCRQPVDANDQFCMHCGVQLSAQVRRCSKCGSYPDASDNYCIFCGQTLTPAQATA